MSFGNLSQEISKPQYKCDTKYIEARTKWPTFIDIIFKYIMLNDSYISI